MFEEIPYKRKSEEKFAKNIGKSSLKCKRSLRNVRDVKKPKSSNYMCLKEDSAERSGEEGILYKVIKEDDHYVAVPIEDDLQEKQMIVTKKKKSKKAFEYDENLKHKKPKNLRHVSGVEKGMTFRQPDENPRKKFVIGEHFNDKYINAYHPNDYTQMYNDFPKRYRDGIEVRFQEDEEENYHNDDDDFRFDDSSDSGKYELLMLIPVKTHQLNNRHRREIGNEMKTTEVRDDKSNKTNDEKIIENNTTKIDKNTEDERKGKEKNYLENHKNSYEFVKSIPVDEYENKKLRTKTGNEILETEVNKNVASEMQVDVNEEKKLTKNRRFEGIKQNVENSETIDENKSKDNSEDNQDNSSWKPVKEMEENIENFKKDEDKEYNNIIYRDNIIPNDHGRKFLLNDLEENEQKIDQNENKNSTEIHGYNIDPVNHTIKLLWDSAEKIRKTIEDFEKNNDNKNDDEDELLWNDIEEKMKKVENYEKNKSKNRQNIPLMNGFTLLWDVIEEIRKKVGNFKEDKERIYNETLKNYELLKKNESEEKYQSDEEKWEIGNEIQRTGAEDGANVLKFSIISNSPGKKFFGNYFDDLKMKVEDSEENEDNHNEKNTSIDRNDKILWDFIEEVRKNVEDFEEDNENNNNNNLPTTQYEKLLKNYDEEMKKNIENFEYQNNNKIISKSEGFLENFVGGMGKNNEDNINNNNKIIVNEKDKFSWDFVEERKKKVEEFEKAQENVRKYLEEISNPTYPKKLKLDLVKNINENNNEEDVNSKEMTSEERDEIILEKYLKQEISKAINPTDDQFDKSESSKSSNDQVIPTKQDEKSSVLTFVDEVVPKIQDEITGGLMKIDNFTGSLENFIDDFDERFNRTLKNTEKHNETFTIKNKSKIGSVHNFFKMALLNVQKLIQFVTGFTHFLHGQ